MTRSLRMAAFLTLVGTSLFAIALASGCGQKKDATADNETKSNDKKSTSSLAPLANDTLDGFWRITDFQPESTGARQLGSVYIFAGGGHYLYHSDSSSLELGLGEQIEIDAEKTPAHITILSNNQQPADARDLNDGEPWRGIYEIRGDELRIRMAPLGGKRPEQFDGRGGLSIKGRRTQPLVGNGELRSWETDGETFEGNLIAYGDSRDGILVQGESETRFLPYSTLSLADRQFLDSTYELSLASNDTTGAPLPIDAAGEEAALAKLKGKLAPGNEPVRGAGGEVAALSLVGSKWSEEELDALKSFRGLTQLSVEFSDPAESSESLDAKHTAAIADVTSLEELRLNFSAWEPNALEPLGKLTKLTLLSLEATSGEIESPVTADDIAPLTELTTLSELELINLPLENAAFTALDRAISLHSLEVIPGESFELQPSDANSLSVIEPLENLTLTLHEPAEESVLALGRLSHLKSLTLVVSGDVADEKIKQWQTKLTEQMPRTNIEITSL